VSLWTVASGWIVVSLLFLLAARMTHGRLNRPAVVVTLAEALALSLLGALWFGSIGRGSWLLVFALLGALVAGAERGLRSAFLRSKERPDWRGFAADWARYLLAGAVLAWRLG
jgi:hypothetical protein